MNFDSEAFAALVSEVRYLRDRQDILDCVCRYSRGLDRHDVDILVSAYHADAVDEHGVAINALPHYAEWVNKLHDNHFSLHLHNITTHNCELDGDMAHCESYVLFGLSTKDEQSVWFGGGRYLDRMERRDGVWRIAFRRTMIDWLMLGENSVFNSPEYKAWGYAVGQNNRNDDSYERPLRLSPERQAEFERVGPMASEL